MVMQAEDPAARTLLWLYYQTRLHEYPWTANWETKLIEVVKRARRHTICVWLGRNDVSHSVPR